MNTTPHDLRQATIDARDWFESRAKAASKGCWSSYELQDLRAQRDALDAALAAPAQAAPANEALKNAALPWPWKTDAEVLDDAISAIEGQNRLKAALRSIAARTTPAASPAQADERKAFEGWVAASGRAHMLKRDDRNDWYADLTVTAWWTAWQASAAQEGK